MDAIYLDSAATTQVSPEVREALAPWLGEEFGNPSSRHALGVRAAEARDRAREQVAGAVGARAREVVFTSGGTEANNLAVLGGARARRREGARVVIGATEHPSVRQAALALREEGFEVCEARLGADGCVDPTSFAELCDERTVLVAQMLVNNEVGSLYPVREVARAVRRRSPGALLHVDAVQGLGKVELSMDELGVDTLSISGHKVHAPKGCGALVVREGVELRPVMHGGGQEGGLRGGTENVAGIVALGVAASAADARRAETARAAGAAREVLLRRLAGLEGAEPLEVGATVDAVCAVLLPGPPAEVWQHHLEARDVYTSVGSACQSNAKESSPVLRALGLSAERARQVMRFSFSRFTRQEDVERAMDALLALAPELMASAR